jgi:hypothetical protein
VNDRLGQAVILLLVLILPLSALIARRVAGNTLMKYGFIWIAVFAILLFVVARFT